MLYNFSTLSTVLYTTVDESSSSLIANTTPAARCIFLYNARVLLYNYYFSSCI